MSGTIGNVDASIPLRAGQGVQRNPLASDPGAFANTLNSFNRLQLFPLQKQQMQQEIQNQQLDIQQKQLNQQLQRLSYFQGIATPLLMGSDGKPTTSVDVKDIQRGLATAVGDGIMTTDDAVKLLGTVPNGGADPTANRQWVLQHYGAISSGMGQLQAAMDRLRPQYEVRNTGQGLQGGTVGSTLFPGGGSFTPAGPQTEVYPSRSELIAPQTYPNASGVPVQTTGAGYATSHGQGANTGPAGAAASGSPPTGANGVFPPGYTGRLPSSPSETLGPAPGTVEPQQLSGQQYAADQRAAGTFGQRVFPLKQAIGLLSDTQTGPGSETLNHFRSFLISMANQGLLPKSITPDAVNQANFDELKKYLSNYITNLPFAAGSDARMAEAVSGNPHANLSTIANQDVARVMVGLERFRQAQYLSFNQQHPDNPAQSAGQYGQWASQFATKYDPRAFAYDLMDEKARTKLYNSLSDAEKQRYRESLKLAYSIPGLMQ